MPGLWICPIILNFWQPFEDALGSECDKVLSMAHLYMQVLHIVFNMSEYGSVCLDVA